MQTAAERILLIGVDWADQLHVAGSPHVEVRLLDQRLCVAGDQLYCGVGPLRHPKQPGQTVTGERSPELGKNGERCKRFSMVRHRGPLVREESIGSGIGGTLMQKGTGAASGQDGRRHFSPANRA